MHIEKTQKENGKKALSLKGVIFSAIILLFFLFLTSIASSDKITNVGDNGLQIFAPHYETIKQNYVFELNFHVSNISNGVQFLNTEVDCYLHLYNTTGHHTFESRVLDKDSNGYDHKIYINNGGTNFSDLGEHSYYIWCNRTVSNLGGESAGTFEVIPSGYNISVGLYLILLIVSLGVVILGFYAQDNWVIILGGFSTIMLGLFTLLYGIAEFRDITYTWAISIITIFLGLYFSIRGSIEALQ